MIACVLTGVRLWYQAQEGLPHSSRRGPPTPSQPCPFGYVIESHRNLRQGHGFASIEIGRNDVGGWLRQGWLCRTRGKRGVRICGPYAPLSLHMKNPVPDPTRLTASEFLPSA